MGTSGVQGSYLGGGRSRDAWRGLLGLGRVSPSAVLLAGGEPLATLGTRPGDRDSGHGARRRARRARSG